MARVINRHHLLCASKKKEHPEAKELILCFLSDPAGAQGREEGKSLSQRFTRAPSASPVMLIHMQRI